MLGYRRRVAPFRCITQSEMRDERQEEKKKREERGEKARRKRAARERVGGLTQRNETKRNDTWTEVYAGNVRHGTSRVSTLFSCYIYGKERGRSSLSPFLSLVVGLESERTIAGAERTRQLRSMMLFLGFWNSLTPLLSPFSFRLSFHYILSFFYLFFSYSTFALILPVSFGN